MLSSIKIAFNTLRASKSRSFLTMLGVIIGVASVILIVSLGDGLKKDLQKSTDNIGPDIVHLTTGSSITRDDEGNIESLNRLAANNGINFTKKQYDLVKNTKGVVDVNGITTLDQAANLTQNGEKAEGVIVFATGHNYADITGKDVESGQFFGEDSVESVVLGIDVALDLFGSEAPLARSLNYKGKELTVIGVMERYELSSPLLVDIDNAIYIPTNLAKEFSDGKVDFQEIRFQVENVDEIDTVTNDVEESLAEARGEVDFSYTKSEESELLLEQTLDNVTGFISAIAFISLLVGGIGIMNIMLAVVSERSYEIGIRKSIGAPNSSIITQFLVEAVVLSVLGALIGIVLAYILGFFISAYIGISFGFSLEIIAFALLVSLIVGLVFGIAPALKAARKNPIEALRNR